MKEIQAWVAEDGSVFLSEAECLRHEAFRAFRHRYEAGDLTFLSADVDGWQLVQWLEENRDAVLGFYGQAIR